MSLGIAKFIGYTVDIQKEWKALAKRQGDDALDRWLGGSVKTSLSEWDFNTFDFVGFYSGTLYGGFDDRVTVLDDGVSGTYTKLMYVVAYSPDAYDVEDNIFEAVNNLLNKNKDIPQSIKRRLVAVYNEMFDTDIDTEELEFRTELIAYYH